MGDVVLDSGDQFWNAGKNAATNPVLCDVAKEAFDHVEPRSTGRSEVHVDALIPRQPCLHRGVLVRGVVVSDHVNLLVFGSASCNQTQKRSPVLVGMSRPALAENFARERVERRQ